MDKKGTALLFGIIEKEQKLKVDEHHWAKL